MKAPRSMFVDPLSITVNAVAVPLPKISSGDKQSVYRSADEAYTVTISHLEKARRRRLVRIDHKKAAADPLSAQTAQVSASIQFIIDEPSFGYDDAQLKDISLGLTGFLTSANLIKVLQGES